jgi:hypothetical protein
MWLKKAHTKVTPSPGLFLVVHGEPPQNHGLEAHLTAGAGQGSGSGMAAMREAGRSVPGSARCSAGRLTRMRQQ